MKSYRFVILGAGPSGLAFAHTLKSMGENSFIVLEKESVAGGLCRSEIVEGFPLDIGGGHFIEPSPPEFLELLFRFMPRNEWVEHKRQSRINLQGMEVDYPLEANLWQLPLDKQLDHLESISQAGCVRGNPMPEEFDEWISWKLGTRIAHEYMLPYNRKIWSYPLNQLGTYWLHKLPDVSFRKTLQSCLERRATGKIPAHGRFLYPLHHGSGEVWKRMGAALGEQLLTGTPVLTIDLENRLINETLQWKCLINTIPWTLWLQYSTLPSRIIDLINRLKYCSIDIEYIAAQSPTTAHWLYEPDMAKPYHRIINRSSYLPGSTGYWTETNSHRTTTSKNWCHHNEFAYPINTTDKPSIITEIHQWGKSVNVIGLGRWGTWNHINCDVAVTEAMDLARILANDKSSNEQNRHKPTNIFSSN